MKRTEPLLIGQIIENVLQRGDCGPQAMRQRASYMWPEVVGSGVNRYTARRYVTPDGVMHVYLTSGPLKNELTFMRRRIVEAINRRLGSEVIKDVQIH